MSGIVGIVNFDGAPVDRNLVTRLTESMTFRGPDARQTVSNGHAGFGHTMLRTTWQAENEKQPLTLDGKVWLTADARLDGRAELGQKLGVSESTHNDAELILLAYAAWKEQCIDHLIGDFAFAIWDADERRLFCARDHFGVKPFYYARTNDSFIFSNTLNTLRLHPSVSDELHEPAIADYLLFGLNQNLASTTFRDIHRLPAGHTLSISKRGLTIRRYWQLTADGSENDCVERFQQLLTTATKDRLRTNRVGISMSGGLDSTGLAAIAQDLLRDDPRSSIHACTNVYDGLFADEEQHYSALAAKGLGIPIVHLAGDAFSLFDSDVATDLKQPEPFLFSPLAGQFNGLLRELAQHGRVALTGYDGDAFMTERPSSYFHHCVRKLKINELIRSMAWYVGTHRSLPPVGFRSGLKRMFRKETPATAPEWLDGAFAARVDLQERYLRWNAEIPTGDQTQNHTHSGALRALESKVWAPLFEGYDPGSTRLPLELRHPFIDVRLLRYVFSLPAVPWCVNKHVLRCALSKRLPPAILNRPKTPLASDPTLHLAERASVRCLDRFDVNPQLRRFVNLDRRRPLADEQTSDGRRASLRVFALNHWLTHSLPIDRTVRDVLAQTA